MQYSRVLRWLEWPIDSYNFPRKALKDICIWQTMDPSVATEPPVTRTKTNLGSSTFQFALFRGGLRSADGLSISFTPGSHDR